MKYSLLVLALAGTLAISGCMAGYTTMHRERHRMAERDSLTPPPMTINDIIALAQDSVSDDVIISQMKATDSYFRLTTDDIVSLRKAGVSDKVINAMIKTGDAPPRTREHTIVYPGYYPYWGYYWYPYYGYPWYYSPFYFGFSYHGGFYGHSHYGGTYFGRSGSGGSRGTRTVR